MLVQALKPKLLILGASHGVFLQHQFPIEEPSTLSWVCCSGSQQVEEGNSHGLCSEDSADTYPQRKYLLTQKLQDRSKYFWVSNENAEPGMTDTIYQNKWL